MKVAMQDRRLTTQRLRLRDRAVDMEIQEKDKGEGPRALARRLHKVRKRERATQKELDEDGDLIGQESSTRTSGAR